MAHTDTRIDRPFPNTVITRTQSVARIVDPAKVVRALSRGQSLTVCEDSDSTVIAIRIPKVRALTYTLACSIAVNLMAIAFILAR